MRRIIYILLLLSLAAGVNDSFAAGRKKKDKRKKELTAYEKVFDGKKVQTARGLMTLHKIDDKVYVEFPLALLGKEMLFTSTIEGISDSGESAVGEFSGQGVPVRFTRADSVLQARLVVLGDLLNLSGDASVDPAIARSGMPGVYGNYKIEAFTPDGAAMLVDMSSLFMTHSIYTTPFADYAGNSFYGFVMRNHKFQEERTSLHSVKAYANNVVATCDLGYDLYHIFFGMFLMAKDMKVSVLANRILMLLPEQLMMPRLADYRVGTEVLRASALNASMEEVKPIHLAYRWRLEPSDPVAYHRGELVRPLKPIVFYMDTLIPEAYRPHVAAGVLEWNKAFEAIGFRDAIQVKDYLRDEPGFDLADVSHSTILFSPVKMYEVKSQMYSDPRTGEILSASIFIPVGYDPGFSYKAYTLAADLRVREQYLPVEIYGEQIRNDVAREMGKCLGFAENQLASSAYPVDSLRSPSFTREYGLSPSIMDRVPANYIARPGDMERGVALVQHGIGGYDYFLVKWLYSPVPGVVTPREETAVLDRWVVESRSNPYFRFGRFVWGMHRPVNDPRMQAFDLGDDPVKAFRYRLDNIKYIMENYGSLMWEDDKEMTARVNFRNVLMDAVSAELNRMLSHVGGVYINEVHADEGIPAYTVVPREQQRAIVRYALELAKSFDWMDDVAYMERYNIGMGNLPGEEMYLTILGGLLGKMGDLRLCAAKSDDAYTPDELMDDLYTYIWDGTIGKRALDEDERFMQRAFVAGIMATSAVAESASAFEKPERRMPFIADTKLVSWSPDTRSLHREEQRLAAARLSGTAPYSGFDGHYAAVKGYNTAPEFYSMLLRVRDLLKQNLASSSGDTREHYEYLLYRIGKALSKK